MLNSELIVGKTYKAKSNPCDFMDIDGNTVFFEVTERELLILEMPTHVLAYGIKVKTPEHLKNEFVLAVNKKTGKNCWCHVNSYSWEEK